MTILAKGTKRRCRKTCTARSLIKDFYTFPNDMGKVYSDMVTFLQKTGYTHEDLFQHLDKAYRADPTGMSPKNIYLYFDMVLLRNKDIDVQLILDTYDNINEAMDVKAGKVPNYD